MARPRACAVPAMCKGDGDRRIFFFVLGSAFPFPAAAAPSIWVERRPGLWLFPQDPVLPPHRGSSHSPATLRNHCLAACPVPRVPATRYAANGPDSRHTGSGAGAGELTGPATGIPRCQDGIPARCESSPASPCRRSPFLLQASLLLVAAFSLRPCLLCHPHKLPCAEPLRHLSVGAGIARASAAHQITQSNPCAPGTWLICQNPSAAYQYCSIFRVRLSCFLVSGF